MDNNYLERLAKIEEKEEIHDKKIDKLEIKIDNIHDLAVSVKELAIEIKALREDINKIENRVSVIEDKPTKRLDLIWGYVVSGIIGITVGYLAIKLGLK